MIKKRRKRCLYQKRWLFRHRNLGILAQIQAHTRQAGNSTKI